MKIITWRYYLGHQLSLLIYNYNQQQQEMQRTMAHGHGEWRIFSRRLESIEHPSSAK